jgi:hypothetical protein
VGATLCFVSPLPRTFEFVFTKPKYPSYVETKRCDVKNSLPLLFVEVFLLYQLINYNQFTLSAGSGGDTESKSERGGDNYSK